MFLRDAAGPSFRAWSRRSSLLLACALVLSACADAAPDGSAGPDGVASLPGATGGVTTPNASAGAAAQSLGLEVIAGIELESATYDVPSVLEQEGGPELAAMLETLGLEPSEVSLLVAVDPGGRLAIGHWELPGADAASILAAWAAAAAGDWEETTLAGLPALAGRGPDGGTAWATAADGVFRYISTDERVLAEASAVR